MTTAANVALVRRIAEEVWNQGNLALLDEVYQPDTASQGRDEYKRAISVLRAAFPDLQLQIEHLVAAGDDVVCRWRIEGTHQGYLRGVHADAVVGSPTDPVHPHWLVDVAPTGRHIAFEGATFFQVRGDRIVSGWVLLDRLSLLHQLGALPVPSRMQAR